MLATLVIVGEGVAANIAALSVMLALVEVVLLVKS